MPKFVLVLFWFVEFSQLIFYAFHPIIKNNFSSEIINTTLDFLRYTQSDFLLRKASSNLKICLFIAALFATFLPIVLATIMLVISPKNTTFDLGSVNSKPSTPTFYPRSLSIIFFLYKTVLILPILQIYISVLYCSSDSAYSQGMNCYSGSYWLLFVISALGLFFFITQIVLNTIFFIDYNPFSAFLCRTSDIYQSFFKLGIKIFIVVCFVVNYKGTYSEYFVPSIAIGYCFLVLSKFQKKKLF